MIILSEGTSFAIGTGISLGLSLGYSLGCYFMDKEHERDYIELLKDIINVSMFEEYGDRWTGITKDNIYDVMRQYLIEENYHVPNKLYFKTLYKKAVNEFEDELRGICHERQ